jgi:predicted oxidoreductase
MATTAEPGGEGPGTGRRLGPDGPVVGPIAYGCWRFSGTAVAEAQAKVEAALDAGMTLVDTADIYGAGSNGTARRLPDGFGDAEALLGDVLRVAPHLRGSMVLATKGGIRPPVPYDQSREYLTAACEASLRRLGVDHVDLYQVHRPDVLTHPADLAATLTSLVERGLVAHVGVSNFTVDHTEALRAHLDVPLATTQPQFGPLHLEPLVDGTLDLCQRVGITPLAWSPLGGGRLLAPSEDRAVAVHDALAEVAGRHDVDVTAAALAWVLHHPAGVVPIVGTQRVERIRAAAAATTVRLDRAEWYRVLVAARGEPLP